MTVNTTTLQLIVTRAAAGTPTGIRVINYPGNFYRAMHFSAKRGIAIACRLSVRPFVRLSACDVGGL